MLRSIRLVYIDVSKGLLIVEVVNYKVRYIRYT